MILNFRGPISLKIKKLPDLLKSIFDKAWGLAFLFCLANLTGYLGFKNIKSVLTYDTSSHSEKWAQAIGIGLKVIYFFIGLGLLGVSVLSAVFLLILIASVIRSDQDADKKDRGL